MKLWNMYSGLELWFSQWHDVRSPGDDEALRQGLGFTRFHRCSSCKKHHWGELPWPCSSVVPEQKNFRWIQQGSLTHQTHQIYINSHEFIENMMNIWCSLRQMLCFICLIQIHNNLWKRNIMIQQDAIECSWQAKVNTWFLDITGQWASEGLCQLFGIPSPSSALFAMAICVLTAEVLADLCLLWTLQTLQTATWLLRLEFFTRCSRLIASRVVDSGNESWYHTIIEHNQTI